MNKITTKRRIHPGYNEFLEARKKGIEIRQMFGKYQYLYESDKGRISLISLPNYLRLDEILWEIYCLDGNLFEDVERFKTKKEAVKRIKELLK